jgi:hypothetical protein
MLMVGVVGEVELVVRDKTSVVQCEVVVPCLPGELVGRHIGGSSVVGKELDVVVAEVVPGRNPVVGRSHLDMVGDS